MKGNHRWIDDAITEKPKLDASRSWWLNQSREQFQETARQQQARLKVSRFGTIALHDKWPGNAK